LGTRTNILRLKGNGLRRGEKKREEKKVSEARGKIVNRYGRGKRLGTNVIGIGGKRGAVQLFQVFRQRKRLNPWGELG